MPNLRLLVTNVYDDASTVLTASTEAAGLPVGNSKTTDRTAVWRSTTGTGTQTIDIDLGSAQSMTCVAIANPKILGAGAIEVYERGSAGSPGAANLVATLPAQDSDTRLTYVFFNANSKRHWQLKWTNPTAANDYAEAGYVFLGTFIEPTVNVRAPFQVARVDPSISRMSVDGQQSFATRTKYYAGAWQFYNAPEADLTNLRTIFRTIGVNTPIFAVLDTSIAWMAWFLRITTALGVNPEELVGRYTPEIAWEEAR
jgi:hypothetical protein